MKGSTTESRGHTVTGVADGGPGLSVAVGVTTDLWVLSGGAAVAVAGTGARVVAGEDGDVAAPPPQAASANSEPESTTSSIPASLCRIEFIAP